MRRTIFAFSILFLLQSTVLFAHTLTEPGLKKLDSLELKPYYWRLSAFTFAQQFEVSLSNPAHSFHLEYSGYPGIEIMPAEGDPPVFWRHHFFLGYRCYIDINHKIEQNKNHTNHNAFFMGFYHRFSPNLQQGILLPEMIFDFISFIGRNTALGFGMEVGRRFTNDHFYVTLSINVEKQYYWLQDDLRFYPFSAAPKLRIGWVLN